MGTKHRGLAGRRGLAAQRNDHPQELDCGTYAAGRRIHLGMCCSVTRLVTFALASDSMLPLAHAVADTELAEDLAAQDRIKA
jgi:hypothetical protein